jgi:hypothetical protein
MINLDEIDDTMTSFSLCVVRTFTRTFTIPGLLHMLDFRNACFLASKTSRIFFVQYQSIVYFVLCMNALLFFSD